MDTVETPGLRARAKRWPVRVRAEALLFPRRSVPVEVHNVSLVGFCASTDEFVPIGGQMILCLEEGQEFAAEIRWAFAGSFGARLVGASKRQGRRLRDALLERTAAAAAAAAGNNR